MTLKEYRKNKKIYSPYFKLVDSKGNLSKKVYFINHYDKSSKKYSISDTKDINSERFVKSSQKISVDFEY